MGRCIIRGFGRIRAGLRRRFEIPVIVVVFRSASFEGVGLCLFHD